MFIYTYKHINIEKLADNVVAADFSYLIFNKIIDNAKKIKTEKNIEIFN